jgi:hypothetical protein
MSDWVVARVDGGNNILYTIISLVGRGWGWVGGDEGCVVTKGGVGLVLMWGRRGGTVICKEG